MYDNATLGRKEYLLDVDQINPGPVATATNSSAEGTRARAGLVAHLKYDYASKYVVEGSMRKTLGSLLCRFGGMGNL